MNRNTGVTAIKTKMRMEDPIHMYIRIETVKQVRQWAAVTKGQLRSTTVSNVIPGPMPNSRPNSKP